MSANVDDNVICLSSDEETSPVKTKPPPKVNGTPRRISPTLLDMGFRLNNGHGDDRSCQPVKAEERKASVEEITVEDDDDFEIEYSNGTKGEKVAGGDSDDDDDIQVLQDNGSPQKLGRMRKSREELCGTKEVSLKQPHLNLGLLTSTSSSGGARSGVEGDEEVETVEDSGGSTEEVETDQEPEEEALIDVNYAEESKAALGRFMEEFCALKHHGVKRDRLNKLKEKAKEAYSKIEGVSPAIHKKLAEDIMDSLKVIKSAPDQHWKTLKMVMDSMIPENLVKMDSKTDEERDKEREEKKIALSHKYEKELIKIQRKIQELDEADVDLNAEDEGNSAYLLGDRYKTKLMKSYYTLCDLTGCNRFTGRATQTKIIFKKHNLESKYEVIDRAVENFVNKRGFMFMPDYTDIREEIQKVNREEALGLTDDECLKIAQQMFENVMKILKKRRGKEFKINMLTMPSHRSIQKEAIILPVPADKDVDDEEELAKQFKDPADTDEELKAKLEANEKLKKSEKEVIDQYAEMSKKNNQQEVEVDPKNASESPPPSDDEEQDDVETEDDEDDVEINTHLEAELTEDEDEEAETVTSGFKGVLTATDLATDDDNSNDGKTTADESDSSSGVGVATGVEESVAVEDGKAEVLEENNKRALERDSGNEEDVDNSQPPSKKVRADENLNEGDTTNINGSSETIPTEDQPVQPVA